MLERVGMMQNRVRVIGITGITGSGTSTAADLLKERGGLIISADVLAHEAIKKGRKAYKKIVDVLGESILLPNGEIDRKKLGVLVFGDENKQRRLWIESLIHPVVAARIDELIGNSENAFVVIDAPLLIESGLNKACDEVWLITAADESRISRIIQRDGVDKNTAERRLRSRQNEEILKEHADVIIANNSDLLSLRRQVEKAFGEIFGS